MRKFYTGTLTIALFLALPLALSAQEAQSPEATTEVKTMELRNDRVEMRQQVGEDAQQRKAEALEKRKEIQEQVQKRMEEAKELHAERREEFRMKLQEISDERKQEIVERIDERLAEMNERITGRLAEHLDRIMSIIDRIEAKGADMEGDTQQLDDAIDAARAAVEASQKAVEEQAGQEYVIELNEESTLGSDVRNVVLQFRNDIKATTETVKTARQKTVDAARALAKVPKPEMPMQQESSEPTESTESAETDELGG